jgi:hypothetical protein
MGEFTLTTSTQEPDLETAMKVIYQWDYDPQLEELRRLYVKAAESQWVSERDLDWSVPIDLERFSTTPVSTSLPFERSRAWQAIDPETRWEMTRRAAAFRLSNFLHGEQGALMVASQLVNAVPHTDAKFYAATQTMDEARHVEVFAKYVEKLDCVRPIAPALKGVLDATLTTGNWMHKLVGMQVVVEGLALFAFKRMRTMTQEPLLKELLTYVARDEARHHAYGVTYVERCVPCLGPAERAELEDFALEAARTLVANQNERGLLGALLDAWSDLGVDVVELLMGFQQEREELSGNMTRTQRLGPVTGFVIPTLRRCGLLSERVAAHYHGFLSDTMSGDLIGETVEEFMAKIPGLPEDTAAWLASEID